MEMQMISETIERKKSSTYETPEIEIVLFEVSDVITDSPGADQPQILPDDEI